MRKPLDFLLIGAQKAGTTTLHGYLARYHGVFVPAIKENDYFLREELYRGGESYLARFFDEAPLDAVWGAAQVQLMYFPECVARIREYNPRIKVIAVLRDPVRRAYSAYWFARQRGTETCATFEEALAREADRAKGTFQERAELTYLAHGHYADQLRAYYAAFGADGVRVVLTEELGREPVRLMRDLAGWLGLRADPAWQVPRGRMNESGMPRIRWLTRFLVSERVKVRVRAVTGAGLRLWVRRRLLLPLLARNTVPFRYPPMLAETERRLAGYYAGHNAALRQLTGRDLPEWL